MKTVDNIASFYCQMLLRRLQKSIAEQYCWEYWALLPEILSQQCSVFLQKSQSVDTTIVLSIFNLCPLLKIRKAQKKLRGQAKVKLFSSRILSEIFHRVAAMFAARANCYFEVCFT